MIRPWGYEPMARNTGHHGSNSSNDCNDCNDCNGSNNCHGSHGGGLAAVFVGEGEDLGGEVVGREVAGEPVDGGAVFLHASEPGHLALQKYVFTAKRNCSIKICLNAEMLFCS